MWAAKLSIATMAFGRSCSAGASTCSTKALNTAVLVAAAMLMQATTPSRVKAPSTVSRFQCPQGTLPRARLPRAARACVRVSRVSIPLSSRKTRRLGSSAASSARHAARSPTRSGRSCSSARRVFCAPGQAGGAPGTGSSRSPAPRCAQPAARRTPPASARSPPPQGRAARPETCYPAGARGRPAPAWPSPPVDPGLLLPAVERRLTHAKQSRNPRPGHPAALARTQRPLAQVRRVGSWHAPASHAKPTQPTQRE